MYSVIIKTPPIKCRLILVYFYVYSWCFSNHDILKHQLYLKDAYFKKRFVHLFRGRFNETLYFCWAEQRDTIEAAACYNGWESNYELFGGLSLSDETIPIYNFVSSLDERWSTNLFLRNDMELPGYLEFQRIHYIPGKVA